MQFCTYGNALIVYRVSESSDEIHEIITANSGDIGKTCLDLLDIYKLRKFGIDNYHSNGHQNWLYHVLDDHLKLVFRGNGKRHNLGMNDISYQTSLFPLLEVSDATWTLPKGILRIDFIKGPVVKFDQMTLSGLDCARWKNSPFPLDLIQFRMTSGVLRQDNQLTHREFIINL